MEFLVKVIRYPSPNGDENQLPSGGVVGGSGAATVVAVAAVVAVVAVAVPASVVVDGDNGNNDCSTNNDCSRIDAVLLFLFLCV